MRVAIVDVGSNTARLLVADVTTTGVLPVIDEREHLGLGAEIAQRGTLALSTIGRLAGIAGTYAGDRRLERRRTAGDDRHRTRTPRAERRDAGRGAR